MSMGGLTRPQRYQALMRSTTLRGFTGGLNTVDDAMNIKPTYATASTNIYADDDGTMRVRGGVTKFKAAAASFSAFPANGIIAIKYFNASLISVGSNGEIIRTLANGTTTRIWDAAHAAALPGAPAPWTVGIVYASFAEFNGELIVCNGVDKPILISSTFAVTYLQDLATLTNVNVPIARYVVSCQRYLIMAGDPLFPNRVHISARDASGTWFGDPAPNDATHLDVGSIVEGATEITGLLPFRDKLLVFYARGTVIGTLGIYDTAGNHTPDFNDSIKDYGCLSHKTAVAAGDDGLMLHTAGIISIKRTLLSTSLKPETMSDLITPDVTAALASLSLSYISDRAFSVYLRTPGQYLCLIPRSVGGGSLDACTVLAFNYRPKLKKESWSIWTGWQFKCGCNTPEDNIFFADFNCDIWQYSPSVTSDDGGAINYTWITPWLYFGQRDFVKNSKYLSFDTRGRGTFTCTMYTENNAPVGGLPALTATFDLGDSAAATTGRITTNKQLFGWPCKFEMCAFKITGASSQVGTVTRFNAITLKYLTGSIRM